MFTVIVSQLTEMKGNLKQWLPKEKTSETTVLKYGKLLTSLNINCFYVLPDFLPWSRWNVIFKQLKTTWFSLTCSAGGSDVFQVSVTRSESCMCSPSVSPLQIWSSTCRAQTMAASWRTRLLPSLCPSSTTSWRRRWWWSFATWGTSPTSRWPASWTSSRMSKALVLKLYLTAWSVTFSVNMLLCSFKVADIANILVSWCDMPP